MAGKSVSLETIPVQIKVVDSAIMADRETDRQRETDSLIYQPTRQVV